MPADAIKALVFDVFGTVVDWRNSIAREAESFLGARGHKVDGQAFALAWRAKYQPAMDPIRRGERGYTNLDILHRENLVDLLADLKTGGLSEQDVEHLNRAWHRLDGWPDSPPGLRRLKTRFIIGTMSNGNVALMVNMAKHAGLPWDVILGAEVAQAYKPTPKTYLTGCALLGLRPEEVMLVAAHNSDLMAAKGCGLRTAFVARPYEYGSAGGKDQKAEHDFDYVAASMTDLADKLDC